MTTQYLSVCSGIEAASVAWHPLGWKPLAFAEIEPFPRAVLEHRWPGVPLHGDFTRLRDETWIVDADVLVGGTPCQAFSVAGKRASLADDRGNLTLEFVRLADAIDDVRRLEGRDPSVLVWENVPGVLSVADNAFGCFLAALVGEDEPLVPPGGKWANAGVVVGPERQAAWRILDAQYFGVAQRRRRVFVVASARDGFDPAEVLLEWEGVRRDTPPSREAGEGTAHSTAPSLTASGRGVDRTGESRGQDPVVAVAFGGNNTSGPIDVAAALNACGTKAKSAGTATTQDAAAGMLVAHSLRGEGFDASEDGTGRGTPLVPVAFHPTQDPISSTDGSTHTMSSGSKRGTATVAVAFDLRGREGGSQLEGPHDTANIRAASGGSSRSYVAAVAAATSAVRRLTPRECERLQGFPDDYTAIPWRKKPSGECPDGPRYKALGNSMAVPVMRWIGRRVANELAKRIVS